MDRGNATAVAIVDDGNEVRDGPRVLLEPASHSVETCKYGDDLLANARPDEIACLVVDQRMPELSGVALISMVARRGMTIPSMLIIDAHNAEIARGAERLGAMTVPEKKLASQEPLRLVAFAVGDRAPSLQGAERRNIPPPEGRYGSPGGDCLVALHLAITEMS